MSDNAPRKPPPKRAVWFQYTDAASVGIEMAVAVTIGAVGGMYIERYLTHWSPWTTLIGIGVGIAAAAKAVLRTANAYQDSLRRQAEAEAKANADAAAEPSSPPGD